MNTIVRTIGGAIGTQVAASIIAGTLSSRGLPTERGFTFAFLASAAAVAIGAVVALRIPRPTSD
jgi:hypothetical protein